MVVVGELKHFVKVGRNNTRMVNIFKKSTVMGCKPSVSSIEVLCPAATHPGLLLPLMTLHCGIRT